MMDTCRPYSWQKIQLQRLESAIEFQRLSHAILFSGPPGIGKQHLADCLVYIALKKHANSEKFKALLDAGTHPDVHMVSLPEDKKQIGVDQIRDLSDQLSLTPQISDIKIAVIQPAELMNRNAANALLKTLEEPSGNTLIVLISHNPGRLPLTIRSRCQHIPQCVPDSREAGIWLNEQGVTNYQAYLELASGAPLLAKLAAENKWLEQHQCLLDDLSSLINRRGDVVSVSAKWHENDVLLLIRWIKNLVKSLVISKLSGQTTSDMTGNFLKNLKISLDRIDLIKLIGYSDFLDQSELEINNNLNQELFFEQIFTRWAALSPT
jgi:DNA polymerase-3 subunit delta'